MIKLNNLITLSISKTHNYQSYMNTAWESSNNKIKSDNSSITFRSAHISFEIEHLKLKTSYHE